MRGSAVCTVLLPSCCAILVVVGCCHCTLLVVELCACLLVVPLCTLAAVQARQRGEQIVPGTCCAAAFCCLQLPAVVQPQAASAVPWLSSRLLCDAMQYVMVCHAMLC